MLASAVCCVLAVGGVLCSAVLRVLCASVEGVLASAVCPSLGYTLVCLLPEQSSPGRLARGQEVQRLLSFKPVPRLSVLDPSFFGIAI